VIEKLWELYESAISEEYHLEQQLEKLEKNEEFYFTAIERSTKNGVAIGILRSIEILESNKQKTWKRAFEVFCKVRGKDIDPKFGFWTPLAEASPLKDGTYLKINARPKGIPPLQRSIVDNINDNKEGLLCEK